MASYLLFLLLLLLLLFLLPPWKSSLVTAADLIFDCLQSGADSGISGVFPRSEEKWATYPIVADLHGSEKKNPNVMGFAADMSQPTTTLSP